MYWHSGVIYFLELQGELIGFGWCWNGCVVAAVSFLDRRKTRGFLREWYSLVLLRKHTTSSSLVGPVANATYVLQPNSLIVLALLPPPVWTFPRSPPGAPTSTTTREILVAKGGTMWARINQQFCLKLRLPRQFRDLLRAANLRRGTHGFTSLPKEGVLRIFSPWKILMASAGFEPTNLGT